MTYIHTIIDERANSKVILTGENAVVFGTTSVACAIGLENTCRIDVWENSYFQVSVGPIIAKFDKPEAVSAFNTMKSLCENKSYEKVAVALRKQPLVWIKAVLGKIVANGDDFPYFSACIDLTFPLGSGLGGSTTSTILILRALGTLRRHPYSAASVFDLAYFGDRIAHGGSASGTDSGTIVFGGFTSFRYGEGVKLIRKHLPLELLICSSGRNESSGTSLDILRRLKARDYAGFHARIQEIDTLSKELVGLLCNSEEVDLRRLGKVMNRNQRILQEMGVSTPEIDHLVQNATDGGALGAKLTGGGCGGVVIVLAQSEILKNIANELSKSGSQVLLTRTSSQEENL